MAHRNPFSSITRFALVSNSNRLYWFDDRLVFFSYPVMNQMKTSPHRLPFCFLILVLALHFENLHAQPPAHSNNIYLIGNSLTWDTLPSLLLDRNVEWHVDCGKNLKYIFDNPKSPCIKSSVNWPEALQSQQYDVLCVQPHFGTNLDEDTRVISEWLNAQPKANLVIHTGWNRRKDFESVYHAKITHDRMVHAPSYFEKLIHHLRQAHPDRTIRCTHAMDVLDEIYHDIKDAKAPFQSFSELYRDDIHLEHQTGRYLVHNLMRLSLEMPLSAQGFQLEPKFKKYLDEKLANAAQRIDRK